MINELSLIMVFFSHCDMEKGNMNKTVRGRMRL